MFAWLMRMEARVPRVSDCGAEVLLVALDACFPSLQAESSHDSER